MTCPFCGEPLEENWVYCSRCGADLEAANPGENMEEPLAQCVGEGEPPVHREEDVPVPIETQIPIQVQDPVPHESKQRVQCPWCQGTTPVGSSFCASCGADLRFLGFWGYTPAVAQTTCELVHCRYCGGAVEKGSAYCPTCGGDLRAEDRASDLDDKEMDTRK